MPSGTVAYYSTSAEAGDGIRRMGTRQWFTLSVCVTHSHLLPPLLGNAISLPFLSFSTHLLFPGMLTHNHIRMKKTQGGEHPCIGLLCWIITLERYFRNGPRVGISLGCLLQCKSTWKKPKALARERKSQWRAISPYSRPLFLVPTCLQWASCWVQGGFW